MNAIVPLRATLVTLASSAIVALWGGDLQVPLYLVAATAGLLVLVSSFGRARTAAAVGAWLCTGTVLALARFPSAPDLLEVAIVAGLGPLLLAGLHAPSPDAPRIRWRSTAAWLLVASAGATLIAFGLHLRLSGQAVVQWDGLTPAGAVLRFLFAVIVLALVTAAVMRVRWRGPAAGQSQATPAKTPLP